MKAKRPAGKPIGGFDPDPSTIISTFFWAGFFPVAPATFASALVAALMLLVESPAFPVRVSLLVVITLVGVWSAKRTETKYGHDASCIVIDEVAGMCAATLVVPWDLKHLVAAFLLFRVLDIVKPPPGYQLESLPGGIGVVADDLVAGFYSLLLLFLAGLLLPSL